MAEANLPQGQTLSSLLKESTLFASFSDSELKQLFNSAAPLTLSPGAALFRQGDPGTDLYYLARGRLCARVRNDAGKETLASRMVPGDFVGEITAMTGGRRTASVYAEEESLLILIPESAVLQIPESCPELDQRLRQAIIRRLRRSALMTLLPDLLGPVEAAMITDIESQARWLELVKGDTLFSQGDPGDELFVVVHGRLQVWVKSASDSPTVVGEIAKGELVGEMSVFTGENRSATVVAMRDTELAGFSKQAFEALNQKYPSLALRIIKLLIKRLKHSNLALANLPKTSNFCVVPLNSGRLARIFTRHLVRALAAHGTCLHLNSTTVESHLQAPGIAQARESDVANLRLTNWLNDQENRFNYIIYEADDTPTQWTRRCFGCSDQTLLVADARKSWEKAPNETALEQNAGKTLPRRKLVLVHPDDGRPPRNTARWLDARQLENHVHLRQKHEGDFKRLARLLTGNGIGLALGGGGAKGFAHIGVVKALDRIGIPIDHVGGTSMGGVIACNLALGWNHHTMAANHRTEFSLNNPFKDYTVPLYALLRCRKLDNVLDRYFEGHAMEDMWINCFVVSSSLTTTRLKVHKRGAMARNVRASVALPGITTPVIMDNEMLIDGGVLNNMPGDIMKKECGGKVMAVNVSAKGDFSASFERFPAPGKAVLNRLMPPPLGQRGSGVPNILELISRCIILSSETRLQQVKKSVDAYLEPPVGQFRTLDFNRVDDIIQAGYDYTMAREAELKQKLGLDG